ncbi:MAG: hypothetical protein B7Z27_03065 [Sphingobacteriia bacterium 32-37-4]|nr:MAG: hypothetical protein B7Z27_03065 [Sphingobacteriia bacterium 32-37-4]
MSLTDEQIDYIVTKLDLKGEKIIENTTFFFESNPAQLPVLEELNPTEINRVKVLFATTKSKGESTVNFLYDHPELFKTLAQQSFSENLKLMKGTKEHVLARVSKGKNVTDRGAGGGAGR